MHNKWISSLFFPLAGLILFLGLALGIELARQALLTANSRTFTLTQVILWFYVFATLLTTVALLGLFWFNLAYTTRSRWIGWIYLLVGLSAVLWIFIEFGMGVYLKVYLTIPVFLNNAMAPGSFFYIAAGGVAMIGLFVLVLPKSLVASGSDNK